MTAVEFLKDFMWMKDHHYFLEADLALAFSKAELMEKEQIIQTWYDCKMSVIEKNPTTADQYYNQTFKSE